MLVDQSGEQTAVKATLRRFRQVFGVNYKFDRHGVAVLGPAEFEDLI